MYIGKEIFFFNTLSHIAGVHYVAMHVARQLKEAGVPINLALVSGARCGARHWKIRLQAVRDAAYGPSALLLYRTVV